MVVDKIAVNAVPPNLWRLDAGVSVWLETSSIELVEELRSFYRIAPVDAADEGLLIQARIDAPNSSMIVNHWGVGHLFDKSGRTLSIAGPVLYDVVVTVRKAARESLVAYAEERGYAMLHASAVRTAQEQIVIFVGDSGAGKTTIALEAVLGEGATLLANDHLIVAKDGDEIVLCSLPTPIPLKANTWAALANRLPDPWDANGIQLERILSNPGEDAICRVYFASGQFGMFPAWASARDAVIVLLEGFSPSAPTAVADPIEALRPHLRFDWCFNHDINTNMTCQPRRTSEEYAADAVRRLQDLANVADCVLSWGHDGKISPLWDFLGWSRRQ